MDLFNNIVSFFTGQSTFSSLKPHDIESSEKGRQYRQSIQEYKAEIVTIEHHIKKLDVQLTHFNKALTAAKKRLAGVEKTANAWAEREIEKRKEVENIKVKLNKGATNALEERRRKHNKFLDKINKIPPGKLKLYERAAAMGQYGGGRRTRRRRKKRHKRRRRTRQKRHQRGCRC